MDHDATEHCGTTGCRDLLRSTTHCRASDTVAGHNIIGSAGVGAGIALAPLAESLGGRVTILGTPAEEGGGRRLRLRERGAFDDADVAMMVHREPANDEVVPYLSNGTLIITMHFSAAHASSWARSGINALDALVLGSPRAR